MARSSYGPRRATTWTVSQTPKPMPRLVRLGRAANDNHRRPGVLMRVCVGGFAAALLALVIINWPIF